MPILFFRNFYSFFAIQTHFPPLSAVKLFYFP